MLGEIWTAEPKPLLVCGNAGVETTLVLDTPALPTADATFHPNRVGLGVSGVGFNLAHALARLGHRAGLLAFAGADPAGELLRAALTQAGIQPRLMPTPATPQSLVLVGPDGGRQVHTDLKDTPQLPAPVDEFRAALSGSALVFLTNVNWTRPLLSKARSAGVPIATDLHAIRDLGNPYDQDYLEHADLLFLSGANLTDPATTLAELRRRFDPAVAVVGLGGGGALLSVEGQPLWHQPAVVTRPVVSSAGAGDALAAAFAHAWLAGADPREALRLACLYASWTCGAAGGAGGHLDRPGWRTLAEVSNP